ncbi:hypothetical protein EG340_17255 [Chryseobacterium indoltheticum]|uniref:Uncharacterized protein n=1 Tax=Chryseobacterium indoltheticum TaxID=254 RepID=A0A3G6N8E0_9FLAO|nr:hypothetical protein EG340_17255 [Chryseobacterium indoltheticum]
MFAVVLTIVSVVDLIDQVFNRKFVVPNRIVLGSAPNHLRLKPKGYGSEPNHISKQPNHLGT